MHSLLLFAQETAEQGTDAAVKPPFYTSPIFMIGIFALLYFVIILPMTRRRKLEAEQQLANSLVPGTKIVTNAGIVGTIVKAKEGDAELVIRSEDTKMRILRSAVTQVLGSETAETK